MSDWELCLSFATYKDLRVDADALLAGISALAAYGKVGKGVTRASFSQAYGDAMAWLTEQMEAAGLQTRVDAVGNVVGRMGPASGPVVMTGSHIDTVRNGGPLDGALGVLAGIEVARTIRDNKVPLALPFEVVAFIDEEGVYLSMLGSMALVGDLTPEHLDTVVDRQGMTLRQMMEGAGLQPASYGSAAYPPGSIKKFLELHIEQGPLLEQSGADIGVVTGIVCQRNIDFSFYGASGHAGTTPMSMRKDAFRAAAAFITRAYALLDDPDNCNTSTRATFGTCDIEPGSPNVIPSMCRVRMDNRDLDNANSDRLAEKVAALAKEAAAQANVEIVMDEKPFSSAALMSDSLIESICECCDALGYRHQKMPSGAGHDAQILAPVCDAGMIFVPSIGGLSHHPDEWTEPTHIAAGANVLLHSLLKELVQ
jgi:N-carbamoyl-L-amino-acid hydrolase